MFIKRKIIFYYLCLQSGRIFCVYYLNPELLEPSRRFRNLKLHITFMRSAVLIMRLPFLPEIETCLHIPKDRKKI